jgi:hypothetical protein
MLDNSVQFYGTIYAPNSTVQAHNSVTITGGVAADKIRFFNSVEFEITSATKNKPAPTPAAATRRAGPNARRSRQLRATPSRAASEHKPPGPGSTAQSPEHAPVKAPGA